MIRFPRRCVLAAALCSFLHHVSAQPNGQQLFMSKCAGCHGLDGRGGEHAPDIATAAAVQTLSDRGLASIVRSGIPAAGMPGFASSLDGGQISAVIQHLRSLQGHAKLTAVPGDSGQGRTLYFGSGGCSTCHMINGQGGFLASDLSTYGGTHTVAEIRESIVDPNKDVDPRRGLVEVLTRSGTRYKGVVRNEDNFSLQMQTADGYFHLLDKSAVVRVQHMQQSPMPSDYESRLGKKGIDDVISYLITISLTHPAADQEHGDEDQ